MALTPHSPVEGSINDLIGMSKTIEDANRDPSLHRLSSQQLAASEIQYNMSDSILREKVT